MAILKFELPKELASPRVKIARGRQERVERYRALELADRGECAPGYVMDKDADFRAREKEGHDHCREGRTTWVCEVGFPRL